MVSSQPLHAAPEYQLQSSHLARLLCCFLFVLVFCMSYRSYGPSYLSLISISFYLHIPLSFPSVRGSGHALQGAVAYRKRERERESGGRRGRALAD